MKIKVLIMEFLLAIPWLYKAMSYKAYKTLFEKITVNLKKVIQELNTFFTLGHFFGLQSNFNKTRE